jgi:large subunit ribosomal protein L5e
MDGFYKGNDKVDGTKYDVSAKPNEQRKPFKAVLDVGLKRTTTGARLFGALKGATDGGLHVPHKEKRFPGYHRAEGEGDKDKYDPKVHRERIFGVHIDKYMKKIVGDKEKYNKQFSAWDKCLKATALDSVEKLYTKVFESIRKDPKFAKKPVKQNPNRTKAPKRVQRLKRGGRKANAKKRIDIAVKEAAKAATKKK